MSQEKSTVELSNVYSREQYATKEFWDNRYKQKQSYFDWYAEFPELKQTFEKEYSLDKSNSILMLGCGNSKLSQQMYQAGYHNIVNIDISPAVIEQMSKISQQRGYHEMKWLVMDATDMNTIADRTFDVVIDKGTLDALISGKNMNVCHLMLKESMRVLKKDGQFILITYGSPQGRKKLFQCSIGLSKYDYYFTRVDLSSMSTLINLMRSNLGNKPLSSITKDTEAMKKSLMEFNLIKVLRRQRKNEKKYIIWSDFAATHPQHTSLQKVQQPEPVLKQTKIEQGQSQQKGKQEVSYNPKKQSFCYVYSIREKFACDLEEVCAKIGQQGSENEEITEPIVIEGDESLDSIGLYADQCLNSVNKAVKYLKTSQISTNPITIYPTTLTLSPTSHPVKLHLKKSQHTTIPCLSKSVYQISIKCSTNGLKEIESRIEKVCVELVEKGGIQVYPSPQIYAYLGVLMQKMEYKGKFNGFLGKYWFPTFRLLSYENGSAKYHISTAPNYPQQQSLKILNQTLNNYAPTITILHKGYLHVHEPRLITLVNFCVLNYCQKQSLKLIVEEFSNQDNEQYYGEVPIIEMNGLKMAHMLARIFSAL